MREILPYLNTLLNFLIIPGIILLNGIRKEITKTNAALSEHAAVDNILFKNMNGRIDRMERIQDMEDK